MLVKEYRALSALASEALRPNETVVEIPLVRELIKGFFLHLWRSQRL